MADGKSAILLLYLPCLPYTFQMVTKAIASVGARRKPHKVPSSKEANRGEQALRQLEARIARRLLVELRRKMSEMQRNQLSEFEKMRRAIEEIRAPIQARAAESSMPSRARAEIDSTVDRLRVEGIEGTNEHWESLARDSEARRVAWTRDGSLVKTQDLAEKWGRTRQALDQAVERGELFNIKIGGRRWYPAVFARLTADDVGHVNLALGTSHPVSKYVFWNRPHGGLGGKTPESAILEGKLARVTELAEAWAEEHGGEALSIHAANA
jgi:hypothetical protein